MESAFDEWKNLFSDSAETVWFNEIKELRKFAMIIHVLGKEMTKVERMANNKLEMYREQLMDIPKTLTPAIKQNRGTPLSAISRSNITKQSYISPDMFNLDSPLSATIGSKLNDQVTELATDDEDVIQTQKAVSPKISCKSRKYFQMKRNQRSQYKPKTPVKQKLFTDEIIENTPVNISKTRSRSQFMKKFGNTFNSAVSQKLEKTKELPKEDDSNFDDNVIIADDIEMIQQPRSHYKKKSGNTFNNTVSQKLEKTKELAGQDDSEATIYGAFDDKSMKVDDIIEMVQKANVNSSSSKAQLQTEQEAKPKRKSPINCKTCDHPRRYCAKHDSQNYTLAEKTFTGLWDLDYNVNNSGVTTDKSTIYF